MVVASTAAATGAATAATKPDAAQAAAAAEAAAAAGVAGVNVTHYLTKARCYPAGQEKKRVFKAKGSRESEARGGNV
eukprot:2259198-Pleurochrysis_carterae.AAC.1